MKRFVRINSVTLFLMLFIALVSFTFYYFYKISNDVQNYSINHDNIISMQLLNKEFESFSTSFNQLNNYSVMNENLETFEKLLTKLQKNILQYYPQTQNLQNSLENMNRSFTLKVQSIEYFKSLNTSLISGSAFLFDLQRSIADSEHISYKTKSLVNETMFYLFQLHNTQNIEKTFIEKRLEQLHHIILIKDVRLLKNFYKQSKVLFTTMRSLHQLSEEIENNKLAEQLNLQRSALDKQYNDNLYQEKFIAKFTFIFMIVIWIIFMLLYIRSRKNQKILQLHASVYANTQEAIVITNPQGHVISVNKAFSDIYGYQFDEIKGATPNLLKSGLHDECFYKEMWEQITNNGIYQGRIVNRTKDGQEIPMWITIKAVYDESNKLINHIGVQTDLRSLEASKSKAEYLAYHDTLTGLYNRVSFEELLDHSLLNAKRDKTKFAVLFIDLDRFKIINDTLGHDIGDRVLIQIALRLETILQKSDVISRWGGDEFVIILHDVVSENFVETLAKKIVEELKKPIRVDHHILSVTVSVGIAIYPKDTEDAQTLIKYADSAMYQAKENGKNGFYCYTSALSKEMQERLEIDLALQNALEKNEIYMVFQPQYSLKSKKIVSAEALVRWESDELGFVPPDKFIPIAEENGFIVKLGNFIFEESCKKYKVMKESGLSLQRIAINVSTIQFRQINLVDQFLLILSRYGLQTSEVEIEITERFFMDNTQNNIKILQNFREHGFAISIDDFGTGYSSMSYLKRLPVDTLKIDKSFVDDIGLGNQQDDAIVDAIVALSKTLNYTIVAEGIETKAQEEFLANHNCDIGQGYLFSRPLKMEDIIETYRD